jgi:hypothetical protein
LEINGLRGFLIPDPPLTTSSLQLSSGRSPIKIDQEKSRKIVKINDLRKRFAGAGHSVFSLLALNLTFSTCKQEQLARGTRVSSAFKEHAPERFILAILPR